ncbi:hypothetical protein ACQPU1_06170 [Clostridium paraputrificum]|uniref:hypothetical protein n=1 Tax=Clostridium TaxID=1485 RepID=UPI003D330BA8
MVILLIVLALYIIYNISFGIPSSINKLKSMIESQDKELFELKISLRQANQKLSKFDAKEKLKDMDKNI